LSGWNAKQRAAAASSAERAGFTTRQTLSVAAAAILAAGGLVEAGLSVVYRAGGSSISCILLDVSDTGQVLELASVERRNVGGNVLTRIMAEHLAAEFKRLDIYFDFFSMPRKLIPTNIETFAS